MAGLLTKFRIEDLHNIRTLDVKIRDNRIVLVGENGAGKSTFANLVYYFLTGQWRRMANYQFSRIVAVIDNKEAIIEKKDISKLPRESLHRLRRLPPSIIQRIEESSNEYPFETLLEDRETLDKLSMELEVPRHLIMDYLFHEKPKISKQLEKANELINKVASEQQVLYLPTYRRIEQELHLILPGLEKEIEGARNELRRKIKATTSYIELVEFGMEDVEQTIKNKMSEIKEHVRNGLSNLTATYFRDVIMGEYRTADLSAIIGELNQETINVIFSRIPQEILSGKEQERLLETINKIKNFEKDIAENDRVSAHFLTKLVELHKVQQREEIDIQEFIKVCNSYLTGKEIIYDNRTIDLKVKQNVRKVKEQQISLRDLSSGEKQIVSLFSHVYLSGGTKYFVIIDEPELSLSVTWQKKFLPDILNTGRCSGLIAATHSPFIYENYLDSSAHSLEEFTEGLQ
ncbi:MAG: AAA family ATPase [Dehalococcoidia bacterium]|jgi:predicted ATP-binding protein involved in virulence